MLADLGYEEPSKVKEAGGPGLFLLIRQSRDLRKHVSVSLRLFDALFLRQPLEDRMEEGLESIPDEEALEDLRAILREVGNDMFPRSDDALTQGVEENDYVSQLHEILRDDDRLTEFVETFRDLVRSMSGSWLRSFVGREERKQQRKAWVDERIANNEYYKIADYAAARTRRRLVFHLVVDGLQGKLLEGLAQLSSGNRSGSGARYVRELVELHQRGSEFAEPPESELPPGLGRDIVDLVTEVPVRPGYLETFKKYFYSPDAQAVVVNVATVDTPSISVRNLPIILSGHRVAGPYGTGIPNFSYLDRLTGRGWYFWGSDVLYMRQIFSNQEHLIPLGTRRPRDAGARTLFERLWRYNTLSCMATLDTGALEKISSEVGLAMGEIERNFVEKVIVVRLRRRANMERELNQRRRWLAEHRDLSDSFLGALMWNPLELKKFQEYARFLAVHEDAGIPDYVLWYYPWPDHFAHFEGPYSDAIVGYRGEYDRLDFYLGKAMDVYASVKTAGGGGSYIDRTLFGVVSDHGLVYSPKLVSVDRLLFEAMREDGIPARYLKLTADEGGLPIIHGRANIRKTRGYDVVLGATAGGSLVMDLFDSTGLLGDEAAWRVHPDYHQLRRQALLSDKSRAVNWIEELKTRLRGVMDLAVVREYGPAPGSGWPSDVESVARIFTSDRGDVRIYRIRMADAQLGNREAYRYRYEVLGDEDPLDLVGSLRDYLIRPGGPSLGQVRASLDDCISSYSGCSDQEWRQLLSYTLRPDVVFQLSQLYDSDRAGTINIFPLRHVGMNSSVPGRHAGESFGEKNGTQLYYGAGLRRSIIQTARNGSLPVSLYHWLVEDAVFRSPDPWLDEKGVSAADQFGYASLLDDSAFESIR
jgi:hypothetical protein